MPPSQAAQPAYAADDEPSLIELWQILARRKALILLCLLVCFAAGAAFAFLKTPVYEASVTLRIGQVAAGQAGTGGLLEAAEELSPRLIAHYGETVADGVRREPPFLKRAAGQKGVASTIELVTEGRTPAEAARLLQDVVDRIRKDHEVIFQSNVKSVAERLDKLDRQRIALEQQYTDATSLLEQLKQRDAVQAALIMLERGRISSSISELDAEKPELTQKLSPPQTRPTELLGEITAPTKAASPKRALILGISIVVGLMGGIMLAFFAEFVSKARAGRRSA